ncbi:MerR family DNA-binding transcriptional regulator [Streptococcus entericus]|uniref:MerR family DNA-binding transcriptional regulator n=1 Tax=Streptococcus entericus TaxID=155680 RepID=UPI0003661A3F|nr:MerR family DNA-binding transcriptional regulator [Streptococcus entericus]
MNSKEFVARSGLAISTVRYYEKVGLLPAPVRGDNNYRSYEDRHLILARFIKDMTLSGFSLKDIGVFLEVLRQKQDLTDVAKANLRDRLVEIDQQIAQLGQLKTFLSGLLESQSELVSQLAALQDQL